MEAVTLEQIHEDIMGIKEELVEIKTILEEELELAEDVREEIEQSRNRPQQEFLSHGELKKEFGENGFNCLGPKSTGFLTETFSRCGQKDFQKGG